MEKEKLLRGFLIFGGCYFIFDGLLHISGIKLLSVVGIWPWSATAYAHILNYLYASFIFLTAAFAFVVQKDLSKYRLLIIVSGIWACFHGLVLLFLVLTQNYQEIFQNLPSLLVWLPFYRGYLAFNAALLFIYSGTVYYWMKNNHEN